METKTYTTIQGDTWDGIAFRLWGEERHMHRIIEANPEHADTLIFSAGVLLLLPQITPTTTAKSSELPPWYTK